VEGIEGLLAELAAWSADQRAEDAAAGRARVRSLRTQLEESASMAGTLIDLGEAGTHVALQTNRGRMHHGVVAAVGLDFVAVRSDLGPLLMITLSALVTVRPKNVTRAATGSRAPAPTTLVEFLGRLAEDRPRVRLVAAGEPVTGELLAVGTDVLSLRCDGQPPSVVYVPAGSVSELSLG
jgi:hypothetical protein